jgi:hypothetical protein
MNNGSLCLFGNIGIPHGQQCRPRTVPFFKTPIQTDKKQKNGRQTDKYPAVPAKHSTMSRAENLHDRTVPQSISVIIVDL